MKAFLRLLVIVTALAVFLPACSRQDVQDAAQRELERAAQQWFDKAKRDLEDAANQQIEQKKDEIIRRYVGKGAPAKSVNLFVKVYKATPDIGVPTGEVKFWKSIGTENTEGFYAQEFLGTPGKTLLALSSNERSLFTLAGTWYSAYMTAGGPAELGPPTSEVHKWNDGCSGTECRGQVQNVGEGLAASLLMQRENTQDVFTIHGAGWLNIYLAARDQGMIGYPITNALPFGEKTGWFGWGALKQHGQMQFFTTPSGTFALFSQDGALLQCDAAARQDYTNSIEQPCTTPTPTPLPTAFPLPVPEPAPAPKPSPSNPPAPSDPELQEFEDDMDEYGQEESAFEEFWDSTDQWLLAIDAALTVTPFPDELPFTGGIIIKKATDGVVRVFRGNKVLKFGWKAFKVADETFEGLLKLERRIRAAGNPKMPPWLRRGLVWQKDITKKIGLEKFECIECILKGMGKRSVDGKLIQDVELAGKTLKKGALVEFKDFASERSIEIGLEKGRLTSQIVDYTKSVESGNKLYLVFRKPLSQRSVDALTNMLRSNKIIDKVEIINGVE